MDPLQALLQQGALKPNLFPPNSRYNGVDTATWVDADGATIVYVQRRFIPSADRFALLQEYTVAEGDRLDNIAAHALGDPERFWQICDANNAMRPEELTETIGRVLRITLPQDVPGIPHA
jgi:hypothetical protein